MLYLKHVSFRQGLNRRDFILGYPKNYTIDFLLKFLVFEVIHVHIPDLEQILKFSSKFWSFRNIHTVTA